MEKTMKENKPYEANLSQLILVFAFTAILGFIIETIFVFFDVGKIVKRGILLGPYCPIYGFGALLLYFFINKVEHKLKNIPKVFILSSLILGSFELLCGLCFKYILNIEMWNYSKESLNILNYTTVPMLIVWGVLGTLYVFYAQPIILNFIQKLKPIPTKRIAVFFSIFLICDFIVSVNKINNNPIILDNLVNPQNAYINIINNFSR